MWSCVAFLQIGSAQAHEKEATTREWSNPGCPEIHDGSRLLVTPRRRVVRSVSPPHPPPSANGFGLKFDCESKQARNRRIVLIDDAVGQPTTLRRLLTEVVGVFCAAHHCGTVDCKRPSRSMPNSSARSRASASH